jgi:hypothetical protein
MSPIGTGRDNRNEASGLPQGQSRLMSAPNSGSERPFLSDRDLATLMIAAVACRAPIESEAAVL